MLVGLVLGVLIGVVLCRMLVVEVGQVWSPSTQVRRTKGGLAQTEIRLHDRHVRPRNDCEPAYCWRINPRVWASRWWFTHVTLRGQPQGPARHNGSHAREGARDDG